MSERKIKKMLKRLDDMPIPELGMEYGTAARPVEKAARTGEASRRVPLIASRVIVAACTAAVVFAFGFSYYMFKNGKGADTQAGDTPIVAGETTESADMLDTEIHKVYTDKELFVIAYNMLEEKYSDDLYVLLSIWRSGETMLFLWENDGTLDERYNLIYKTADGWVECAEDALCTGKEIAFSYIRYDNDDGSFLIEIAPPYEGISSQYMPVGYVIDEEELISHRYYDDMFTEEQQEADKYFLTILEPYVSEKVIAKSDAWTAAYETDKQADCTDGYTYEELFVIAYDMLEQKYWDDNILILNRIWTVGEFIQYLWDTNAKLAPDDLFYKTADVWVECAAEALRTGREIALDYSVEYSTNGGKYEILAAPPYEELTSTFITMYTIYDGPYEYGVTHDLLDRYTAKSIAWGDAHRTDTPADTREIIYANYTYEELFVIAYKMLEQKYWDDMFILISIWCTGEEVLFFWENGEPLPDLPVYVSTSDIADLWVECAKDALRAGEEIAFAYVRYDHADGGFGVDIAPYYKSLIFKYPDYYFDIDPNDFEDFDDFIAARHQFQSEFILGVAEENKPALDAYQTNVRPYVNERIKTKSEEWKAAQENTPDIIFYTDPSVIGDDPISESNE